MQIVDEDRSDRGAYLGKRTGLNRIRFQLDFGISMIQFRPVGVVNAGSAWDVDPARGRWTVELGLLPRRSRRSEHVPAVAADVPAAVLTRPAPGAGAGR